MSHAMTDAIILLGFGSLFALFAYRQFDAGETSPLHASMKFARETSPLGFWLTIVPQGVLALCMIGLGGFMLLDMLFMGFR
jgi:hypothetical protein